MIPGAMRPGLLISKPMPTMAMMSRNRTTCGSAKKLRNLCFQSMGYWTAVQPAALITTRLSFTATARPSSFFSRSAMSSAMKSMTFSRSASRYVLDTASFTARSAQAMFRFLFCARLFA